MFFINSVSLKISTFLNIWVKGIENISIFSNLALLGWYVSFFVSILPLTFLKSGGGAFPTSGYHLDDLYGLKNI